MASQVVSGNPSSVTHTYADGDANYTISATATDEDGTFAAGNTVGVAVHNVAPTLTISGAADVNEGSSYTLNLSSFDPGADTISSVDDQLGRRHGSRERQSVERCRTPMPMATHNYTISATATDEDGTFAAGNTVGVTVHNVAPTLTISGASNVNEGSSYTLNLSSSDPGADTITQWTINWGDSTQVVSGNPSSVSHTYADGVRTTRSAPRRPTRMARLRRATRLAWRLTTWRRRSRSAVRRASTKARATRSTCRRPIRAPTRSPSGRSTGATARKSCSGNPSSVSHTYADGTATTRSVPPRPTKTARSRPATRLA